MPLTALQEICDLALPRSCAGCGEQRVAFCTQCRAELEDAVTAEPFEATPTPCPPGFPVTWSQAPYDGAIAELLRAFKDSGRGDAGPHLARLLRSALAGLLEAEDSCRRELALGGQLLVVPMPSRSTSTRARGREPTVELGRRAVDRSRRLVLRRVLRVARSGRDQAGLSAHERSVNLRGAMRLTGTGRTLVPGRVCVVIDDIVTTGSSLVEARATLLAAGAIEVLAATVAATQRRGT
ncbi:MAG TPA: phosphoribosyltransferase family protein [Flexivirga sp.]|uniref:ComF family protein n=1 Tax=Flexivirga sp. TaxID=1962927 RepID=UPI002B9E919E|nr:phosphoribosyltransferase family protein [Flexivirga sp.]HWC23278.1 phosphoribosyltransferase family protein [Flexivirga sp.]